MASVTVPSVVIINRNYPPRAGVTGESACYLASYLKQQGIDVSIVTVKSDYAGGGSKIDPVGSIHEISSWYDGKNKILRLLSSFSESFRLVSRAKKLACDQTIVMTDPPFLSFWGSRLLSKDHNWVLWSMDLYPEAFLAGRLASGRSWIYRFLKRSVYQHAPNSLVALGPLQAKYLQTEYARTIDTSIVPCGVFSSVAPEVIPQWKLNNPDKIILGYCGNLGEAHSTDFLKDVINNLDKDKMHLVLSLYGVKAKIIQDFIEDKMESITLVDNVTRPELSLIDVHLVSLLSRWVNVCVPSKAVSAVCSESSFLFYGSSECDNWHLLRDAGWLIEETEDAVERTRRVVKALKKLNYESIVTKKENAHVITKELLEAIDVGFQEITDRLRNSL